MAGSRKFGCGPIGLVVLALIVFGVISGDDDDEAPRLPAQPLVQITNGGTPRGSPIMPHTRYVTADTLNVRASPATNAHVLLQVARGTEVTLTRQDGAWYGVSLSDGSMGWLHGDYLAERLPSQLSRVLSGSSPARPSGASCHPSYVGMCLPIGRDVDCGDLPGSVSVVGADVYRLDRDGDGVGCE